MGVDDSIHFEDYNAQRQRNYLFLRVLQPGRCQIWSHANWKWKTKATLLMGFPSHASVSAFWLQTYPSRLSKIAGLFVRVTNSVAKQRSGNELPATAGVVIDRKQKRQKRNHAKTERRSFFVSASMTGCNVCTQDFGVVLANQTPNNESLNEIFWGRLGSCLPFASIGIALIWSKFNLLLGLVRK